MNTYELSDGTFVATQALAKASGQEWQLVEIPNTSKPDLIEWLNERERSRGKTESDVIVYEDAAPAPAPPPAPVVRCDDKPLQIEEAIWTFNHNQCLNLLRVLTHRIQELLSKPSQG